MDQENIKINHSAAKVAALKAIRDLLRWERRLNGGMKITEQTALISCNAAVVQAMRREVEAGTIHDRTGEFGVPQPADDGFRIILG